jgi:hypothetical protein
MSGDTGMVIEGPECCILEICCGGEEQEKALAMKIEAGVDGINKKEAYAVAEWIIDHYDLAPKGSLVQLKRTISTLARTYPAQPGY